MTATPFRHIVWDWNGTLLDDVAACVDAINAMIRRRGLRPLTHDHYRRIFQFPVKSYYVGLGFDLEDEDWDAIAREFHANYDCTSREAGLRTGVQELLRELRTGGVPMSILSASEEGILENMLQARGIASFFEHVYGLSDLYAASKLELGHALLDALPAAPADVLLIGDTTHDHEVAAAMGCRCWLLAGGHQAPERLRECGCPTFEDLATLADALRGGLDIPPAHASVSSPTLSGVANV